MELIKHSDNRNGWSGTEIAIIGMAGRFPGAASVEGLWANLRDGVESVTFFTDEQLLASGVDPEALRNERYVNAGCIIEGVELFDAGFFGFSPREAAGMDPQQRLFLECVWEAIEAAGYDTERLKGTTSLFAGASMSSYLINNLFANPEAFALAGMQQSFLSNSKDSLATLIAYKLNLKGGCYTVSTFCSTSLVAVHLACQSLLDFECDMAVAGGVRIGVPQNAGYWYEEGSIVSPDGHCRPFDANAQGTVFGNGLGAVVLKRLTDALADGDRIEAVILGSAINNDGSLKVGYTAPSVAGQSEVIVEALANAGASPETISYVEAHGTGTALGDPTEMAALTKAFRSGTQKKGFCAIGSVKANLGHLDAAAGVTSLIKTVLALKNKQVPPSLNFQKANDKIDFVNSPFYVNSTLSEWKSHGIPRRAGVSCFGIGGTNAHLVLQESPVAQPAAPSRPYQLLVFSAKTRPALETATRNAIEFFKSHPDLNPADAAYTLQTGRRAFNHRRAIVCRELSDAAFALETLDSNCVATDYQDKRDSTLAFLFPGIGAQYAGMAEELYRTEQVFREQVDRCAEVLQPHIGFDIRSSLYPNGADAEDAARRINQPSIALLTTFVVDYALAKLWMAWGFHPTAMFGYSSGEYVAACLAGVFSLEDVLALVAARGRLIENKEPLPAMKADCRALDASFASHSSMMEPILDAFAAEVRRTTLSAPRIPFISNVSGTWISPDEAMSPEYWLKHLRSTLPFSDGIGELLKESNAVLLEVGPGNTLASLAKQHLSESGHQVVLSSMRHPQEQASDAAFLLNTLGQLWINGVAVDWSGFYATEKRHRVLLPTYPFERRRHWVEPVEPPAGYFAARAGLSRKQNPRPATEPEVAQQQLAPRNSELRSTYAAPQSDLEEVLITVWQEFFGIDRIGIHDNFFELGGDSLSAVRLTSRVRSLLRANLPPGAVFDAPTVANFASYMIAREIQPGLTEKTASLLKRISGMSEQEVSRNLSATTVLA